PTAIRLLRLEESLHKTVQVLHRFRQVAVDEWVFPLHDVAVCLRGERPRSALAQHVPADLLNARGRLGIGRYPRVQPKQRGKPGRVPGAPTDAVTEFVSLFVGNGFQKPYPAEVKFALERSRPWIWLWQSIVVAEPFTQRDQHGAFRHDECRVEAGCIRHK